MAISFIGSASATATNGNDPTVTLPGGMAQNDLVIVVYGIGDNDNVDFDMSMVTAGYTEVADLFSNDTFDANLGAFYKFMGATPDTTAVPNGQGGANASVGAVAMVFRGVDTTTPMDVTATTATGLSSFIPNPPSINHNNPSGVWTVIGATNAHDLAGGGTFTFPTGYTVNAVGITAEDTTDSDHMMGYRTNPADPEDPGVITPSGTDSASFAWCAVTMALRPAAVNFTLAVDAGTYAITGNTAGALASRLLTANAGSYAVTGFAATLTKGFILLAASGAYAITGNAASTLATRLLSAVSGAYALTGSTAGLTGAFVLIANTGAYAIVGADATLIFTPVAGGAGVYTMIHHHHHVGA